MSSTTNETKPDERRTQEDTPTVLTKSQKKRLVKKNKKVKPKPITKEDTTELTDEQIRVLLIVIDCNITKEDAINVLKVKYPTIHNVLVNDNEWDLYYSVYLELKKNHVEIMDL
jgi:uncharacterized pyridoxamine 5'-phosphate oxidase family protein